jgi:hypothetical protein
MEAFAREDNSFVPRMRRIFACGIPDQGTRALDSCERDRYMASLMMSAVSSTL